MQLSKKQIDLMKHCVGLHRGKPYRRHGKLFYKPSRNYFDCGKHDDPDWSELANCGYAVDFNGQGWYKLTGAGFSALSRIIGIHIFNTLACETTLAYQKELLELYAKRLVDDPRPSRQRKLRRFSHKPNCIIVPVSLCLDLIRGESCDGCRTEREDETCECCKHCRYHYANQEEEKK